MSDRLNAFIAEVERAVASADRESALLPLVADAMRPLVAVDDWLPSQFSAPHPRFYQQYLLHLDPRQRFAVVSFVWGPGQGTPIHDHTVWGVIGMLRGAELTEAFTRTNDGMVANGTAERLEPGDISVVSPRVGDIHRVSNAFDDRASISIHVYGADIGRVDRHVFDQRTGQAKTFVSGYANRKENAS